MRSVIFSQCRDRRMGVMSLEKLGTEVGNWELPESSWTRKPVPPPEVLLEPLRDVLMKQ